MDVTVHGVRKTAVATSLEKAKVRRDELLTAMKTQAEPPPQDGWTLTTAFERTLLSQWSGSRAESTAMRNAQAALTFFGKDTSLSSITTDAIDNYVIDLMKKAGNSDGTINRKLSALSTMLKTAVARGQLDALPKMPRRKEREGRIRFLSQSEEDEVLHWFEHIAKPDHKEATIVLVDTGFRTGELWGCHASNVNLSNATISLWKTKNGKPRTIPMTKRVLSIVTKRCTLYPKGQLFPEASNDWFANGWERVRLLMGKNTDPEFVPHALRHTCCSRLVQRGVPLLHVQAWMGHKATQTTMRYAHLAPHDLFSLAAVLSGGEEARWQTI